jgi:hypothetical protein
VRKAYAAAEERSGTGRGRYLHDARTFRYIQKEMGGSKRAVEQPGMGLVELLVSVVFGLVLSTGIALTLAGTTQAEFWWARACYVVAELSMVTAYLYWIRDPLRGRLRWILGVVVFLISCGLLGGLPQWARWREAQALRGEPAPVRADVSLRFIYPTAPNLVLMNKSTAVAKEIKWSLALWNADLSERNDPLPIPVSAFDWIRPGAESGPLNLFSAPMVASLLKPGDRLIGSASVICPECARGRTYLVYIVWQKGGWFVEVADKSAGELVIPAKFSKEERMSYFDYIVKLVPELERVPIE